MRQTKQLQLIRRKMSRGILGAFVLVISAATPTLCLAATNGSNPSAARSNTVSGSNTSYLISYSSDKVIPVAPAPLPSKANANVESVLPTVVVPFTAGVDIPNPPAPPKQVLAPVPASVASKLAAYYIVLDTDETMYLVAPQGLKGKMEIGADGSAGLNLHGQHMEIDLDHAGASPFDIWGIASPFYASVRKKLAQQLPGSHTVALRRATIQYSNDRQLVKFAFTDTKQQYVTGYTLYVPNQQRPTGAFSWAARLMVVTDKTAQPLARWIMASGIDALNTIGDPFLTNTAIPSKLDILTVGHTHFSLTLPTGYAGDTQLLHVTNRGTVWIDPPKMLNPANLSHALPSEHIPGWDWFIQLSNRGVTNLDHNEHTRTLAEIGPVQMAGLGNPVYVYPTLLQNKLPNWVLYTTTEQQFGMGQPYSNDLYAINLTSGKQLHLTAFTASGGTSFSLGNTGDIVVWDQSGYRGKKETAVHSLWEMNLSTGAVHRLATKQLDGETVHIRMDGRSVLMPLKNVIR